MQSNLFVCILKTPHSFRIKTLNKHTNEKWQKFRNSSRFPIFRIINCLFQVKSWNWIFYEKARAIKYFKNNVVCFLFISIQEIHCNLLFFPVSLSIIHLWFNIMIHILRKRNKYQWLNLIYDSLQSGLISHCIQLGMDEI